ncbi:MAG: 5'-nucleotidase C-terminal domain-containing protein, partial [Candidatus Saccharibacteria bacterium]|nr:5'-nucleotidase C-terminal domain-containing protein [Pseudorhodobacter sp.]
RLVLRNAFDLYPHPNTLAALLNTGAEAAQWLERSFSAFHPIPPGMQDAALLDTTFPSYNFDLIEGLEWRVDLSAAPRYNCRGQVVNPGSTRIIDLRHDGKPLDPTARFVLATNSYRAAGSGGFPAASTDRMILSSHDGNREVLLEYISRLGTVARDPVPNWRFVPMPGTTVLFDSAPAASAHLTDLAPLTAEALDLTPTGFRRFRLHL